MERIESEPKGFKDGEDLLAQALPLVESASIRSWVVTEQNRPIWVQIAQKAVDNKGKSCDKHMFAAYIVATAIGL
jgi:hypothetical protein